MNLFLHTGHQDGLAPLLEQVLDRTGLPEHLTHFISTFISETVEIFCILIVVMLLVSFIQTFINFAKLQHKISRINPFLQTVAAVFMGVLSPFCSCSIVPVLMGMLSIGVPALTCIVFITSASLLNATALLTLSVVAGMRFTVLYVALSLVLIVVSALILHFMGADKNIKRFDLEDEHCHHHIGGKGFSHRIRTALHGMWHVLHNTWGYILIGVAISSAMAAFIPFENLTALVHANGPVSVLLAGVIGTPIHSDIFTLTPMLMVLKDVSLAVAMTFTLSTMAISIPEAVLLTRAIKTRFIVLYSAVLALLSIISGLILLSVAG